MALFKNKYRIESARLRGWDYTTAGGYFVTICVQNRECVLGDVSAGQMVLSPVGQIASECWLEIPKHTKASVYLDEFVVMPNHLHGIVVIEDPAPRRTRRDVACPRRDVACNVSTNVDKAMAEISPLAGSLSAVIRSYKSAVTRMCGRSGVQLFDWQARFFDHIVRNETELRRIRGYITENPTRWEFDKNNAANLWM